MELESLRYFLEVAKSPSLSKAAQNLSISQQGLGKAMAALEKEVGATLVTRTHAGASLTAQGERFLPYAERILDEWGNALLDMGSSNPTNSRIRVAISPYLSSVSTQSAAFAAANYADLSVIPLDKQLRKIELESAEETTLYFVELYGAMMDLVESDRKLIFEQVLDARLGVIWTSGCPFHAGGEIGFDELAQTPLALNTAKPSMRMWEKVLAEHPSLHIEFESSSWDAPLAYAKVSGKACLMEQSAYSIMLANGLINPRSVKFAALSGDSMRVSTGFLYRADARISPDERQFIDGTRELVNHQSVAGFRFPSNA